MKILVLDTETLGLSDPRVYDLGYLVYDDETGEILCMRDYIISQVYNDPDLMKTAYYANKLPIYEERLEDGYCKKISWQYALRVLARDIHRFGVEMLWAYNSRFDENSIRKTCEAYGYRSNPTANGIADIMKVIGCITDTDEYREFCESHGFMTAHRKPRCQRKAETLYRYMMSNPDYNEEHTALEDSKIELEILLKCQQTC